MHKIVDKAVMADGTEIQLEDWHDCNSEEYPTLYGYTIGCYPQSKEHKQMGMGKN